MYTILIVKDIVAGNCEKRKGLKCLQLQLQMACICVNLVAHHFKSWNSTHFKISSLTSDIFVGKGRQQDHKNKDVKSDRTNTTD